MSKCLRPEMHTDKHRHTLSVPPYMMAQQHEGEQGELHRQPTSYCGVRAIDRQSAHVCANNKPAHTYTALPAEAYVVFDKACMATAIKIQI